MMSMYKNEGYGFGLKLGLVRPPGVRVSSSRQRAMIQSPGGRRGARGGYTFFLVIHPFPVIARAFEIQYIK